ncbi:unnamed protein product [Sphagnum balticum]
MSSSSSSLLLSASSPLRKKQLANDDLDNACIDRVRHRILRQINERVQSFRQLLLVVEILRLVLFRQLLILLPGRRMLPFMMAAVLMRLERSAEVLDLVDALALAAGTSTNRDDFATFVNTEETARGRTG